MSTASRPQTAPVRLGDVPAYGGDALRFVQERLALFGKTIFAIAMTFFALSLGFAWLGPMPLMIDGRLAHILASGIALFIWLLARRSRLLPPVSLHVLDGLGTISLCACLAVMGYRMALSNVWGFFAGTLAVFHVTLARAIIVPSIPLRTFVITAVSFSGLVIAQQMLPVPPAVAELPAARWLLVLGPITWSATGSALATLGSAVVYGLQERVMEARQLGQYTLEEKIGAGGMGEVYRARHAMLRRPTAIKLMAGEVSEEHVRRFEKEVQLTALLRHPNTVSIYDYGRTPEGTFYYAMELLEGMTLEELIDRDGPQAPSRVIHILLQACGALYEAHETGLIHRDVKPANIFLSQSAGVPDMVKVLDFGLVKELRQGPDAARSNMNVIVGTPLYMAPEAIASPDGVSAKSDLYALGAVAYFLLSATPVFSGKSVVEICGHHLHTPPEALSRRVPDAVPADLEAVVLACLAKSPASRPESAQRLADSLRRCAAAGAWTERDAEAWWRARRDGAARPAPRDALPAERRTVRVDLDDRRVDA